MSKVRSKREVTLPKAVADQYGIVPGDEIDFVPAGETIRVVPRSPDVDKPDIPRRMALFDAATRRLRQCASDATREEAATRRWTREELCDRAGADRR